MNKITLEDLLKHFGLKGNLYLKRPEMEGYIDKDTIKRYCTKEAFKAYEKLTHFIYDLADYVNEWMRADDLATELKDLVKDFDNEISEASSGVCEY